MNFNKDFNTIIDATNNKVGTLENRRKAYDMVESFTDGLFGSYHYKVQDIEFKQHDLHSRYSQTYWTMTKGGKTIKLKYKYVMYITMKRLGFIS